MSTATRSYNDHQHNHRHGYPEQPPQHQRRWQQLQLHGRRADRSGPLRWIMAVVFTVLAILVLLGALAVLLVVLLLQPRAPFIAVQSARLDSVVYDQQGALDAQLSLGVVAVNSNARMEVSFSELELNVTFHGAVIAILRADPFSVRRKGALPLNYQARTAGAPLDSAGRAAMDGALSAGVVPFTVAGKARTHWKVGGMFAVKYWTRLACDLRFFWPNGTALDFTCNSKSKSRY